jgi:hypothetical protein
MTSRPDSKDSIDGSPYPALLRTASTSEYNTRLRAVAPLMEAALRWLAAQTRVGGAAAADGRQAGAPRGNDTNTWTPAGSAHGQTTCLMRELPPRI